MRIASYIRVSTDDQSTENQRPEIEALATRHGWTVEAIYEEKKSAAKRRPEFERLMKDAHVRRFDVFIIWALDRFGRSMSGNLADWERLVHAGVRVVSVKESWLDQPSSVRPLLVSLMSWVAEQERTRLIERTRAGMDRARRTGIKSGLPIGGPRRATPGLDKAIADVGAGTPVRTAARTHGVALSTLQRRCPPTRKGSPPATP